MDCREKLAQCWCGWGLHKGDANGASVSWIRKSHFVLFPSLLFCTYNIDKIWAANYISCLRRILTEICLKKDEAEDYCLLGCCLMNVSVNKRVATFIWTSRRMLDRQEAVSESESLCQARSLIWWLPNFHLLVKRLFLMGVLPSDANFWEAGRGPSVVILALAWVGVRR